MVQAEPSKEASTDKQQRESTAFRNM